jgi:folate-binding protein YgfZ
LNPKGKIRADMRVLLTAPDELVVESSQPALDVLLQTIESHRVGFDFELADHRHNCVLLSMIGPGSDGLAAALVEGELPGSAEHENSLVAANGSSLLAVRTDLGLDLVLDGDIDAAQSLRDRLLELAGEPAGPATVEALRVETGRPLLGRELDGETIPQEAGLNERAVSFTKGCYVGQETVARLFHKGKPNRHLRGLEMSRPAEPGEPVRFEEKQAGTVGTAVVSPVHGPIALAILRREAQPGDTVSIGEDASAVVVDPVFEPANRN